MNKSKRLIIFGASGILLIVVALVLYNSTFSPKNDIAKSQVSVRMKWFFAGTMTGWFAGREENFYSNKGLDVILHPGGPDNSAIKLVAAGTDMFGVAGADEVLIAREKGIPVVPIAVLFKESPIAFISKSTSGITTPKHWIGKTIEVDYGSNAEIQFRALAKLFNVSNFKEVPYTYSLVPFIENKVDVSVAYVMDQVVTLKNQNINLNVITAKQYGVNPYGDVIFTTEKTLNEQPELVDKFLQATIESHQWAIKNPSEAIKAFIKSNPNLKADNELAVWQATIPFLVSDEGIDDVGKMDYKRWEQTQYILLQFKALNKKNDLKTELRLND